VGGMPLAELFPTARLESMRTYLREFAAGFGIDHLASPDRLPNTRRARSGVAAARRARPSTFLATIWDTLVPA